jgi:hypothetical protein
MSTTAKFPRRSALAAISGASLLPLAFAGIARSAKAAAPMLGPERPSSTGSSSAASR